MNKLNDDTYMKEVKRLTEIYEREKSSPSEYVRKYANVKYQQGLIHNYMRDKGRRLQ